MRAAFRRNLHVTSSFFLLRFLVAFSVAVAYIFVAAAIQYAFVGLMGESTFNYIAGGLMSLLLGVIFCNFVGSLVFMFVRGWHVAALAYAKKIYSSGAPAITVGMKVFGSNLVSFGAVYGVRALVRSVASNFTTSLWDLFEDVPLVSNLKSVAENPIVEHMAKTMLDYSFDATIYYLIRNKPEELSDVPGVIIEGLKRYLCCLPGIMLTAIGTYGVFEVLPAILKVLIVFYTFMTNGICAGILITVLMVPLFYILDNTFFKPITMMMFMTCFAAQCDKEVDSESKVAQVVSSVIDGFLGSDEASEEDLDSEEQVKPEPDRKPKRSKAEPPPPSPEPTAAQEGSDETAVPTDFSEDEDPSQFQLEFDGDAPLEEPPIIPLTQAMPKDQGQVSAMADLLSRVGSMPAPEPRIHESSDKETRGGIGAFGDALQGMDPHLLGGFGDDDEGGDW